MARMRCPRVPEVFDRLGGRHAAHDRQVKDGSRGRPHGLRVVDVDGGGREHDAVGARGVRRAHDRPGVPGIPDLMQDRDTAAASKPVEADIDERGHAHDALRRDGGRQPRDDRRVRVHDVDADLAGSHGQLVQIVLDEEGLQGGRRLGQRLAHALGTLDEEAPVVLPHRALVQPRSGNDLGILDAGDHETPRDAGRPESSPGCSVDGGASLRRPTPAAARPSPAARAGRRRSGRARRGRRGSCGRPRPPRPSTR